MRIVIRRNPSDGLVFEFIKKIVVCGNGLFCVV